ncbi:MAG: hypothetical protein ACHQYQ_10160 [Bacteriovoracales bacterium]
MEPKKFSRNKRRRPGNRFRRPEKKSPIAQYEHLTGIYLQARKKFFERFDPERPDATGGLEKVYYEALERLRSFERSLTPEESAKVHPVLKLEVGYTQNRGIPIEGTRFQGIAEDPHFLKSQETADFKTDNEESTGTFEDYLAYKGL